MHFECGNLSALEEAKCKAMLCQFKVAKHYLVVAMKAKRKTIKNCMERKEVVMTKIAQRRDLFRNAEDGIDALGCVKHVKRVTNVQKTVREWENRFSRAESILRAASKKVRDKNRALDRWNKVKRRYCKEGCSEREIGGVDWELKNARDELSEAQMTVRSSRSHLRALNMACKRHLVKNIPNMTRQHRMTHLTALDCLADVIDLLETIEFHARLAIEDVKKHLALFETVCLFKNFMTEKVLKFRKVTKLMHEAICMTKRGDLRLIREN